MGCADALVTSDTANGRYLYFAILLAEAEPGSGGCLDALNPRETRGARVAPTPSPPVERRDAASQTLLRKVRSVESDVRCIRFLLPIHYPLSPIPYPQG